MTADTRKPEAEERRFGERVVARMSYDHIRLRDLHDIRNADLTLPQHPPPERIPDYRADYATAVVQVSRLSLYVYSRRASHSLASVTLSIGAPLLCVWTWSAVEAAVDCRGRNPEGDCHYPYSSFRPGDNHQDMHSLSSAATIDSRD